MRASFCARRGVQELGWSARRDRAVTTLDRRADVSWAAASLTSGKTRLEATPESAEAPSRDPRLLIFLADCCKPSDLAHHFERGRVSTSTI